jgi:DNA-directed RNA polymerase subunit RPC12/RpoP
MEQENSVLEYKCPSCGGGLHFGEDNQQMKCPYCESEFGIEQVLEYNSQLGESEFQWEDSQTGNLSEAEQESLKSFACPNCGGEILTEETTAATFCPYCDNPAIMPGRVSGGLKPDGVIPFKTSKEDAKAAFLKLCKGKPLLPKLFTEEQRVEKITGIYVPFWLYDCDSDFHGHYKATRINTWSDSNYTYTRTSYYHLVRAADAQFVSIPMDASKKMENAIMESIEPFDYSQIVDFETAYLSGFLADKYDVESVEGKDRVKQRVTESINSLISNTIIGYSSVIPMSKQLNIRHGRAKYVLLPVWMLHTKYKDKTYVFAMNGQTGKMTGSFPICPKRTGLWFGGIWAGVTAVLTALLTLLG